MAISKEWIEVLLSKNINNVQDELFKSKIIRKINDSLNMEDATIPYNYIAEFVFKNENSREDNEILNENIRLLLEEYSEETKGILSKNLDKIKTNYSLSQVQRDYILRSSKQAEDIAVQLNSIIKDFKPIVEEVDGQVKESKKTMDSINAETNTMNKEMSDIRKDISEVRTMKSGIYTDFIAILGVFSAFVFVMFGGIDVARAIFDIGSDLQTLDLSRMITIACLMLIGILTLMYSLLLWIAIITGKNFGNCHSPKCINGCNTKRHFFKRHSFYFFVMSMLIITTVISYWCF